jgi:hypothetical protein
MQDAIQQIQEALDAMERANASQDPEQAQRAASRRAGSWIVRWRR